MKRLSFLFALLFFILSSPSSLFAFPEKNRSTLSLYTPESHTLLTEMPDLILSDTLSDRFYLSSEILLPSSFLLLSEGNRLDKKPAGLEPPSLPMVLNHLVTQQITFFTTIFRKPFERALETSGRYLIMIQKIFTAFNLPKDLAYLPLIESGFNVHAASRAQATGLWQFVQETARRYGLRVDRWIDERRDPVKSTRAAARYLNDLYKMFGSWWLVLAAYNAGEGRVSKAMEVTRSTDFWTLRSSNQIPQETQQFVPKFIAATVIAKDSEAHSFSTSPASPLHYDEVPIAKQTSLDTIARAAGLSVKEIKDYNPELKGNVTPSHYPDYRLKLPFGRKELFFANLSRMNQKGGAFMIHRIRRGETLSGIAMQYHLPMKQLLKVNRLHEKSLIRAGESLRIPRL